MGPAKDKLSFEKEVSDGWRVLVPAGTWHNITKSARRQCRSTRSTRPPTIHPTRCRPRRRRRKPTKTTSQRLGQCSKKNMPQINTGDRKELGKPMQSLVADNINYAANAIISVYKPDGMASYIADTENARMPRI